MGRRGMDLYGLGQGRVTGSCEHGNEPSGSINFVKFFDGGETISLVRKRIPVRIARCDMLFEHEKGGNSNAFYCDQNVKL
jgi:hypothetical protein